MSRPAFIRELRPTLMLALPIIVGQVSQMLMGLTDSVMIGRTGTVPLAASAFGGNVFSVFYVLGIGLMLPVSVLVSRARGASRPEDCGEYLRHGLVLALAFGAVETLVLLALGLKLAWFDQPPEVLAIVNPFYGLIGVSITPVLLYLAMRQYAEAMGRPWVPMFIMLGGVGLNAFLNWVLIYGHLGVPALGLTGAGISTLTSRSLGTLVLLGWVHLDPTLRRALPTRWLAPLDGSRLREMLHLGLPASGMLLFESGAFAGAAIMMGWLGAVPLASHQIAISCAATTFMFLLGLSAAAGMRVSAAVGAGESARLRPIGFSALGLGVLLAGTFMLLYLAMGRRVAGWFVTDPAVIALATQLLVVTALFQVFDGGQVIGAAILRGLSDVRVPAVITFIAYWVIAIPGGYLLGIRGPFGALGIWSALAAGLAFAALFLGLRFARLTRHAH
ncbi:MAG TPA: MATE family efflux transporter [Opitutaceae bacterium]|nr:MATE family efflux transporter [Opitutaceae bacterium]HND62600.1 MATE family efflux transporter [Opitutaceae bacterium]